MPTNNTELYREFKSYIGKNLLAPEEEIAMLIIYSVGTHFYLRFTAFPILQIIGDFATGKNRRVDLMKPILNNP